MESCYNNSAPDLADMLVTDIQMLRDTVHQLEINIKQTQSGLNQLYQLHLHTRKDIADIRNTLYKLDSVPRAVTYKSNTQKISEWILLDYIVPSIRYVIVKLRYMQLSNIKRLLYKQD